jgi:hypothetical protein
MTRVSFVDTRGLNAEITKLQEALDRATEKGLKLVSVVPLIGPDTSIPTGSPTAQPPLSTVGLWLFFAPES